MTHLRPPTFCGVHRSTRNEWGLIVYETGTAAPFGVEYASVHVGPLHAPHGYETWTHALKNLWREMATLGNNRRPILLLRYSYDRLIGIHRGRK